MPDPAQRLRLFVAVGVGDEVSSAVESAVAPMRSRFEGLTWTRPGQWHLTLAFLGSVDAARVAAATEAVAEAAAATGRFRLALDGTAGTFRSGVLWAALAPSPELSALATRLHASLRTRGFDLEGWPFSAHLTLARARRRNRLPAGLADAYDGPALAWDVREIALLHSRPGPGGAPRYGTLATAPLPA